MSHIANYVVHILFVSGCFLLNICLGDASILFVVEVSSLNVCLTLCCMNLLLLTHSLSLSLFKKVLFIMAVSDLNCSLQDLPCVVRDLLLPACGIWLWRVGSAGVAHGLWSTPASVVATGGLRRSEAYGTLVSRPGIEPISSALRGGFFTTGLPGKCRPHFPPF